ncbi:hypothetical protein BDZ89DRAFT_952954 [Hymenopellis radicata]|nr:hypothetical protein BDZ89DRAFT_952954 [Hymenopellis radicata]
MVERDASGRTKEERVEAFYTSLSNTGVVVGAQTQALKAIIPTINHRFEAEAILDEGAQIVAMSSHVWRATNLPMDREIKISVQSANKGVDESLGMCRNVPFTIGDLTMFLQVHVIDGVAYDILLGRPFSVLGETITQNYMDGSQALTIHDPNSGQVVTVPTHTRGNPRFAPTVDLFDSDAGQSSFRKD